MDWIQKLWLAAIGVVGLVATAALAGLVLHVASKLDAFIAHTPL
jgi:hypothetical protein